MSRKKNLFAVFACASAVLLVSLLVYRKFSSGSAVFPLISGADILLLLLFSFFALLTMLRRSLRETLYSYKNVMLTGGVLYIGVTAIYDAALFFLALAEGSNLTPEYFLGELTYFPKLFSTFAVTVILLVALAVCISNISLIRHEGLCLNNILGAVLGGFFILFTLIMYIISHLVEKNVTGETAGLINTFVTMFLMLMLGYFECMFIGTCIMSYIAAKRIPSYDKDYIIILGCSIDKRGGLLPLLKGRANRAVRFAWDQEIATGRPCRYIPSGGQGPNEIMSEGSAMELYLLSHGAEDYEVFPEKKSANTYENMLFSKAIVDKLSPGAKVAYATTNYHVFRSGILARTAGLDAEGIAAETKWYFWPNGFIREFFAIMAENRKTHIVVCAFTFAVCVLLGVLTGLYGML